MMPVEDFLSDYRAKATRNKMTVQLRTFFRWIGTTPEDYPGSRNVVIDLQNFVRWMEEEKHFARSSIWSYIGTLKEYFRMNGVELTSVQSRSLKKTMPKTKKAITRDISLSKEDARRIAEYSTNHIRPAIFVLISTGMRPAELLSIEISDVNLKKSPGEIKIYDTKNGDDRICYLTDEAVRMISDWLDYRNSYLESSKKKRYAKNRLPSNKLFPYCYMTLKVGINNAMNKANLTDIESRTKRRLAHPYSLRKFFRTRLGLVIPNDAVEELMGHRTGLNESYRRLTQDEIQKYFIKGMDEISIYSGKDHKMEEMIRQSAERERSLLDRIESLENRVDSIPKLSDEELTEIVRKIQETTFHNPSGKYKISKNKNVN